MTRRIHAVLGAGLALAAASCTVPDQPDETTSHISGASFRDSSALTVFMADILARSLDAPRSTLILAPYAGEDPDHAQILLTDTLRERGFALSPGGMPYPGGHTVRYAVSPMGQELVLELDVDDASATCLYGHDAEGALRRTGSCTLRTGGQLTLRIPPQEVLVPAPAPSTRPMIPVRAVPLPPLAGAPAGQSAPVANKPLPLHPDAPARVAPIILAPPPPPPPPPVETWTLVEGTSIRDQMIAWGDRAGWKVQWPTALNWAVPAMTTFRGDYIHAAGDVLKTIAAEGKSIRGEFHTSNRMLIVTSPGGEAR